MAEATESAAPRFAGVFAIVLSVFILHELGFGPRGLSRLAASCYAVVSILVVFAALRPALRTHAGIAVRRAGRGGTSRRRGPARPGPW